MAANGNAATAADTQSSNTDKQITLNALAVPPHRYQLGANVQHVTCQHDGPASQVLAQQLELPEEFVAKLIGFGALYYCPVHPKSLPPQAQTSAEQNARVLRHHQLGVQRHGTDVRIQIHQNGPEVQLCLQPKLQHPQRVSDASAQVHQHGFCRVHVHPKRFPRAYIVDWRAAVLLATEHYVAVNKPWGVQITHRVDNILESVVACVSKELMIEPELRPVHRLDCGTEGVVVLARTAAFARHFQKLLLAPSDREGTAGIGKVYRALSHRAVEPGLLCHWAHVNSRLAAQPAHTRVVPEAEAGAVECRLEVLQVQKVSLCEEAAAHFGCHSAYEHKIRLITGRTHQIRAQLAAMSAPLLGDALYTTLLDAGEVQCGPASHGAAAPTAADVPVLSRAEQQSACRSSRAGAQADGGSKGDVGKNACADASSQSPGDQPWWERYRELVREDGPLGLQAAQLTFADATAEQGHVTIDAGPPWWRNKHECKP